MPKLLNYYQADKLEAGCDEAGRGCYAGPVFAAAVILPKDFYHPLINDSKKLSEKQRAALAPIIKEAAIAWAIGSQTPAQIDEINILNASFLAMHRAVDQLKTIPESLLIDGNRFKKYKNMINVFNVRAHQLALFFYLLQLFRLATDRKR